MSVVQEVGSQTGLLGETDLLEYLKGAPEGYAVEHLVTRVVLAGCASGWAAERDWQR